MQDLSLRLVGSSLVVACGFSLSSCGTQAPEGLGSVVCSTRALVEVHELSGVARRLSCPAVCGIIVP